MHTLIPPINAEKGTYLVHLYCLAVSYIYFRNQAHWLCTARQCIALSPDPIFRTMIRMFICCQLVYHGGMASVLTMRPMLKSQKDGRSTDAFLGSSDASSRWQSSPDQNVTFIFTLAAVPRRRAAYTVCSAHSSCATLAFLSQSRVC